MDTLLLLSIYLSILFNLHHNPLNHKISLSPVGGIISFENKYVFSDYFSDYKCVLETLKI